MNYLPTPYKFMAKQADEKYLDDMTYEDGAKFFNDRLRAYADEAIVDKNGSMKRQRLQALGLLSSALLYSLGGGAIGGLFGGKKGLMLGAMGGLGAGFLANGIGQLAGFAKSPRTRQEQSDYTNSDKGIVTELLVPGVAAYSRGRTERYVYDAMAKELQKYMK